MNNKKENKMKDTLYELSAERMSEFDQDGWCLGGPCVDAVDEPSLEDAISHIDTCCAAVLADDDGNWDSDINIDSIPSVWQSQEFLSDWLDTGDLVPSAWQDDIRHQLTVLKLTQ
tara:strand:- start:4398 stop:4742 length:345 start_codon:yes stop_codon:yes gene_type:complete